MCKNEEKLICTALASVKPFIDCWVIIDTTSEDQHGLPALRNANSWAVEKEMSALPGRYIPERPWKNWAANRSETIYEAKRFLAERYPDEDNFIFILDADERVVVPADFKLQLDPSNAYWVNIHYGAITYARPNILSSRHTWKYVGVTHEYLAASENPPRVQLPITLETNPARTDKTPEKCALDAKLLEEGLIAEPENSRYRFYLAQSYRDCGQIEKAIGNYEMRAKAGGWFEEVWYSLFQVALLKEQMKSPEEEVIAAYLAAYENNPHRAEALGSLARYLRCFGRYNLALMFAAKAKSIPVPDEKLFIDLSFYKWRCLDEYSIAAYWTGNYRESLQACDKLLTSGDLPAWEIERVNKNKNFSQIKLPAPTPAVTRPRTSHPLVSAVMLIHDRVQYLPQAIECFLNQTYVNSELVIVDDGHEPLIIPEDSRIRYVHLDEVKTIGAKRNIGCQMARGDVIVNWDDDDWSHPHRIESQVARLLFSNKMLTGYNRLLYWNEPDSKTYKFICEAPYAAGSSQCFWKTWWGSHQYPDLQSGEDRAMSETARAAGQLDCQDGGQMLVARAHHKNTWEPPLGNVQFPTWDRGDFPIEFLSAQ